MNLKWLAAILTTAVATEVAHPDYEPFDVTSLDASSFFEQFLYENLSKSPWIPFYGAAQDVDYNGQWAIEEAEKYPGLKGDKGLVMKTPAAHYSIAYKLEKPFDNKDKTLVLQYEVKTQNGLNCGGTYLKLLDKDFNGVIDKNSPFQVMFGPDKCGSNDRVHFIFSKKDPSTGQVAETQLQRTPMSKTSYLSTLYTLIFKPNQEFEIRLNGHTIKSANLRDRPDWFTPPLNVPREIDDTEDAKPSDWEDDPLIIDESVKKPDDYDDRYLSPTIPDPKKRKPKGWLDREPKFIPDPLAEKPAEWVDEEDGEWEAPVIPNPVCTVGCGEWVQPRIPNPEYKGPWSPPLKKNPRYRGPWRPGKIPNPDYVEIKNFADLKPIGGIGIEVWTVESEVMFNNIYLGHSIEEAERIGNLTFLPKLAEEEKDYKVNKPQPVKAPVRPPITFDEVLDENSKVNFNDVLLAVKLIIVDQFLEMKFFWNEFNEDPLNTLTEQPLKAGFYACVFLFVFTFAFGVLNIILMVCTGGAKAAATAAENKEKNPLPEIVEPPPGERETSTATGVGRNRSSLRKR